MWAWYTAEDRREAAGMAFVVGLGGAVVALAGVLVGGALAGLLSGGLHGFTDPARWAQALAGLPRHLSDPGVAFGGSFSARLYWMLTILVVAALLAGFVVFGARPMYRALAPTGRGFVTRHQAAQELSVQACRKRAKTTRPGMSWRERIAASPCDVGIPLHQALPTYAEQFLPLENATGVVAPQQSGKSLMDLIHKVLGAPGGMLNTSTKPELFLLTALARERKGSRVSVLDLTGKVAWHRRALWDPTSGPLTVKAARRRADALVYATAGQGEDSGSGNHRHFLRRARNMMMAYILAARASGAPIEEFVRWCQDEGDQTAANILKQFPEFSEQWRELRAGQQLVQETRDGVWDTLRDSISCLTDSQVRQHLLPRSAGQAFDIEKAIRDGESVYIIGSADDAAVLAPMITAFVQEVFDVAKQVAAANGTLYGWERLDPIFTAVLDEVANICPLPDLPETLSDSAGRGLLIHYALQSQAQADERWGRAAAALFDNTTALTIFGGLKNKSTLEWVSLLVGERTEERRSVQVGERWSFGGSRQISSIDRATMGPGKVRLIPRGRALVIHRYLPPIMVRLEPAWKRKDWKQLQEDAARIRQGKFGTEPVEGHDPGQRNQTSPGSNPQLTTAGAAGQHGLTVTGYEAGS